MSLKQYFMKCSESKISHCIFLTLENSQDSQENTCARASTCSFIKKETLAQVRPATLFKKETLAQVFSFEFYKISNNTFSTEQLRTTASEELLSRWRFQILLESEAYSEPSHTSKVELFVKIVNG